MWKGRWFGKGAEGNVQGACWGDRNNEARGAIELSLCVRDGLKRALVVTQKSCMPKENYIQETKLFYEDPVLESGCNHTFWRSVYSMLLHPFDLHINGLDH